VQLEGSPVEIDALKSLALYNYGHFTSMRVEAMRVRGLSMHLERLANDSGQLFGGSIDPVRVRQLVRRAATDGPDPVIVRVTVFAPDLQMAEPSRKAELRILVTLRPAPSEPQPPLRVKTVRYERDLPNVKHTGLFGQILQRRNAQLDGFDDALFVNADETVSEGATWNIAFIRLGRVIWPASNCLPGVTMRLVKESLARASVQSVTAPVTISSLTETEAAFITNAAIGVRPVSQVDNHNLAPDIELLAMLRESYRADPGEAL
jgi:branched-subunit amino acid aminotransferase/4-amino-4-deoxychorismate lyase